MKNLGDRTDALTPYIVNIDDQMDEIGIEALIDDFIPKVDN